MADSKYQTLINVCKRGQISFAEKLFNNWAYEYATTGEFFDIHFAGCIIDRYKARQRR